MKDQEVEKVSVCVGGLVHACPPSTPPTQVGFSVGVGAAGDGEEGGKRVCTGEGEDRSCCA